MIGRMRIATCAVAIVTAGGSMISASAANYQSLAVSSIASGGIAPTCYATTVFTGLSQVSLTMYCPATGTTNTNAIGTTVGYIEVDVSWDTLVDPTCPANATFSISYTDGLDTVTVTPNPPNTPTRWLRGINDVTGVPLCSLSVNFSGWTIRGTAAFSGMDRLLDVAASVPGRLTNLQNEHVSASASFTVSNA